MWKWSKITIQGGSPTIAYPHFSLNFWSTDVPIFKYLLSVCNLIRIALFCGDIHFEKLQPLFFNVKIVGKWLKITLFTSLEIAAHIIYLKGPIF